MLDRSGGLLGGGPALLGDRGVSEGRSTTWTIFEIVSDRRSLAQYF